mmetsp:Transcript_13876/g.26943  ORF Transcript_13876/g.26943 Transcript_13876/m.26943 type:complete len:324 (+) Transcript_13876:203-1174(+)|eukprot:CAMPEP_0171501714 /NCGR_PEP_ID=MMETSP0958-20121227/9720_1 /TAXON_ID=87120 /ORGANISM="Aurantiochytrium limacinum, Strain ATCCMYA-1381" /LENGTH=323 /DNA_ID=CAMNT_0012036577 /DNA_START=117 /DNA_END=1088 /DNA_ORIENTATION=-
MASSLRFALSNLAPRSSVSSLGSLSRPASLSSVSALRSSPLVALRASASSRSPLSAVSSFRAFSSSSGSGDKDDSSVSEEDLLNSFSGKLARRGFVPVDEARVREVMGKPPISGSSASADGSGSAASSSESPSSASSASSAAAGDEDALGDSRGSSGGVNPLTASSRPDNRPLSTSPEVKQLFVERLRRNQFRPGQSFDPMTFIDASENLRGINENARAGSGPRRTPRPARLERTGQEIHFTNLWFLSRFMSPMGKILPRYKTGLSKKKQRRVGQMIRRARQMGLLSYFHRYVPGILERTEGEAEPSGLAPPRPTGTGRQQRK